MKLLNALAETAKKRDNIPMERLEASKVRATIEDYCDKYLTSPNEIFQFEALPSALDAVITVLESPQFLEKYEFSQVTESCFMIRLKDLNLI